MKANHLRMGNFVGFKSNPDKVVILETKHFYDFHISDCYFDPIPLTDKWFEKFGFYKDDEYWSRGICDYKYCFKYRDWAKNWAFYQEFTDSPNSHDDGIKYPVSFDIEFVHQLQNLWFSLQHEELKIKE